MPEKIRNWTKYRLDPAAITRAKGVLDRARSTMSLTDLVNTVLVEFLDAVENTGDSVPMLPTVATLRGQLGLFSLEDARAHSAGALLDIQQRLAALEARLGSVPPALRVAEDSPHADNPPAPPVPPKEGPAYRAKRPSKRPS